MSNFDIKDLIALKEFLKWKKEQPQEYRQFIEDLMDFFKDMKIVMEAI